MFPEDERLDLRGGELQFLGNERAETGTVQHGAEAINLLPWETESLDRELREDIDRIGYNEYVGIFRQASRLDTIENLDEKSDVAIDEIEPRFIGFSSQSRRD